MIDIKDCKEHHTALTRGYISRIKKEGEAEQYLPYKGRYGVGYIKLSPNFSSTRYCYITYYIKTP